MSSPKSNDQLSEVGRGGVMLAEKAGVIVGACVDLPGYCAAPSGLLPKVWTDLSVN